MSYGFGGLKSEIRVRVWSGSGAIDDVSLKPHLERSERGSESLRTLKGHQSLHRDPPS